MGSCFSPILVFVTLRDGALSLPPLDPSDGQTAARPWQTSESFTCRSSHTVHIDAPLQFFLKDVQLFRVPLTVSVSDQRPDCTSTGAAAAFRVSICSAAQQTQWKSSKLFSELTNMKYDTTTTSFFQISDFSLKTFSTFTFSFTTVIFLVIFHLSPSIKHHSAELFFWVLL